MGWIQELWSNDYSGGIRVPTEWPKLMGANNLLPGLLIFLLSPFQSDPNLYSFYTVKFLVISLVLIAQLTSVITKPKMIIPVLCGFLLLNTVYSGYMNINYYSSNWLYIIILLEIIKQIASRSKSLFPTELITLFFLLMASKSQIIYISMACILVLVIKNKKYINYKFLTLVITFLFLFQVTNLLNSNTVGGRTAVPQPFGLRPEISSNGIEWDFGWVYRSFWTILDWYPGIGANLINQSSFTISQKTLLIVLAIFATVYVPYFLVRKQIGLEQNVYILDTFMFASLLTWTLIKHPIGIGHVALSYISASVVTIFAISRFIYYRFKDVCNSFRVLVATPLLLSLFISLFARPISYSEMSRRSSDKIGITVTSNLKNQPKALHLLQVVYALQGKRLEFSKNGDYSNSQVHLFIKD